jgi:hypothetical protein
MKRFFWVIIDRRAILCGFRAYTPTSVRLESGFPGLGPGLGVATTILRLAG